MRLDYFGAEDVSSTWRASVGRADRVMPRCGPGEWLGEFAQQIVLRKCWRGACALASVAVGCAASAAPCGCRRVSPAKTFEALRNSAETVAGIGLPDASEPRPGARRPCRRMTLLCGVFELVDIGFWVSIRRRVNRSRSRLLGRSIAPDRARRKRTGRALGCSANTCPSSQNVRDSSHDCVLILTCEFTKKRRC